MNPVLGIGLTLVLLALNAVFVAAEFALVSARRSKIEPLAEAGSSRARVTVAAMEQISEVMAAAQLGITVCTLGLGAISEPVIAHLLEIPFHAVGIPDSFVHPIALVIATAAVVWTHVVLAEMVPKNLALVGPERAAMALGPFMRVMVVILKPLVIGLNAVANAAMRLFRVEPKDEVGSSFTHDEVAGMIEESRREGLLDEQEYGLLSGALGFQAGTVASVVLPTASLITVSARITPAELELRCAETGFSRFPTLNEHGEMIGYLHIKDGLEIADQARNTPIPRTRIRDLAGVRADTGLDEALQIMRSRETHLAHVTDVQGAVIGLVTLEDVLEELIGEIRGAQAPV